MDRKLILSVAGSGKTSLLIDRLDENRRFLVVTYTDKNTDNIKRRTLRKFGYIPKNITIYTYFEFLMAVCYRPFFSDRVKAKGICWKMPDSATLTYNRSSRAFYLNKQKYLYYNRIALICSKQTERIKKRTAKYYDCIYYDEAQDLNGHDLNLMLEIIPDSIESLFVGDYFQHTFSTSTDGNTNHGLYENFTKYKNKWRKAGFVIDETTLSDSHRCSISTCRFVKDKVGIEIHSATNAITEIKEICTEAEAEDIIRDNSIPKLFFQKAHTYMCRSLNWGESKGLDDFDDICIVLNKTTLNAYQSNQLHKLPSTTKNKLYVACTRAKRNLYFVSHAYLEKYKRETTI